MAWDVLGEKTDEQRDEHGRDDKGEHAARGGGVVRHVRNFSRGRDEHKEINKKNAHFLFSISARRA